MRDRERGQRDRFWAGTIAGIIVMGAAWTVFVDVAPEQYAEIKSPIAEMLIEERIRHIYVEQGPRGAKEACGTPLTELGVAFACKIEEDRDGPLIDDWLDLYAYAHKDQANDAARIIEEGDTTTVFTEREFEDLLAEKVPPGIDHTSTLLGWRAKLDR